MQSVIMLSVFMLSVFMLSVLPPCYFHLKFFRRSSSRACPFYNSVLFYNWRDFENSFSTQKFFYYLEMKRNPFEKV
jgi:hypothetical protein